MKRLLTALLLALMLATLGCGGVKDRGANTGKDMPRSADGAE